MINNVGLNTYNTTTNHVNFSAIRCAEYAKTGVVMYKLEKRDISYLQHLLDNLDQFYKKYDVDNESARQVIKEAFEAGIEILKGKKRPEKKADILMSFLDNEPSSILIGNALKIDKNGKYHYSSRKEHKRGEYELDWLATWNKKIPGEGRATVCEYFKRLIAKGVRYCFVRSEIPEKSSAVNFYTRMGFKKLSDTPRAILRPEDNKYLIGKYDDKADTIIPMLATTEDMKKAVEESVESLQRVEVKHVSCKLPEEKFV